MRIRKSIRSQTIRRCIVAPQRRHLVAAVGNVRIIPSIVLWACTAHRHQPDILTRTDQWLAPLRPVQQYRRCRHKSITSQPTGATIIKVHPTVIVAPMVIAATPLGPIQDLVVPVRFSILMEATQMVDILDITPWEHHYHIIGSTLKAPSWDPSSRAKFQKQQIFISINFTYQT